MENDLVRDHTGDTCLKVKLGAFLSGATTVFLRFGEKEEDNGAVVTLTSPITLSDPILMPFENKMDGTTVS